MLNNYICLLVSLVFLSSRPVNAVNLDLEKFKNKAHTQILETLGKKNFSEKRIGQVIFVDGAGSLDLQPLFDYGAFYYLLSPTHSVLPYKQLQIAYRVGLNGSEQIVQIEFLQKDEVRVSDLGSLLVTLKDSDKAMEVAKRLVTDLKLISPEGKFKIHESLRVMVLKMPPRDTIEILKRVRAARIAKSVDLNNQVYRVPFTFAPLVKVSDSGKIDAEKYRSLVKMLKAEGRVFATEPTVPDDLQ